MTDRVIVTDVARLRAVLADVAERAARHGWRVEVPPDAEALEAAAVAALRAHRLPTPVVVVLRPSPGAGAVDAAMLLARTPVAGAEPDAVRRRITPPN